MCLAGQPPAAPANAAEAIAMAQAGLGWLAEADVASLTTAEQAECLRSLERARSVHTAARSRVLAAFHAQDGCTDDGHGSTRTWLKWQSRIGDGAASDAIGWMRRLSAHPAVANALAQAEISESFARQVCEWTDLLPSEHRGDADQILLAAVAGGAELRDLADLVEEIRRQTARPDADEDDGFDDRSVHLARTFRGAGKLGGDLTPQCAAALAAVLEALGKRAGPEDLRSKWQRDHDALEEACRRLIAADCLPERAGQPTQIQLLITLDQLRGLPGTGAAEAAWAAAGPGYDCDATLVPVVTGHVDNAVLDQLTASLLTGHNPVTAWHKPPATRPDRRNSQDGEAEAARWRLADNALRQILIARAADLLSGPTGLAAYLRTGLMGGPAASMSLPLDVGAATETIPAHLRRLVITRDRRCRFPGCNQPPAACQPHHIIPRSQGGPTSLTNLLLCAPFIISSRSTGGAGASSCSPTGQSPPPAPTAPGPCALTARPARPPERRALEHQNLHRRAELPTRGHAVVVEIPAGCVVGCGMVRPGWADRGERGEQHGYRRRQDSPSHAKLPNAPRQRLPAGFETGIL